MTDDYFTCKRTNRNRLTENEHMFTGGRVTGERQTQAWGPTYTQCYI